MEGEDLIGSLFSSISKFKESIRGAPRRPAPARESTRDDQWQLGVDLKFSSAQDVTAERVAERLAQGRRDSKRQESVRRICEARRDEMMNYMKHECPTGTCRPMSERMLIEEGRLGGDVSHPDIYVCRYNYVHQCSGSNCNNVKVHDGVLVCKVSNRELGSQVSTWSRNPTWQENGGTKEMDSSYTQEVADFDLGAGEAGAWETGARLEPFSGNFCGPDARVSKKILRKKGEGQVFSLGSFYRASGGGSGSELSDCSGSGASNASEVSDSQNTSDFSVASDTPIFARGKRKRAHRKGNGYSRKVMVVDSGRSRGKKKRNRVRTAREKQEMLKSSPEEVRQAVETVHFLLYGERRLAKDREKLSKLFRVRMEEYLRETRVGVNIHILEAIKNSVINSTVYSGQSTQYSGEDASTMKRRRDIYARWALRVIKHVRVYMVESGKNKRMNKKDYVAAFLYLLRTGFVHKETVILEKDAYLARHMPLFPQLTPMGYPRKGMVNKALENIKECFRYAIEKGKVLTHLRNNPTLYL